MDMEKDGAWKMDRQNKKNSIVLERVEQGRIRLELIKKRPLAKKELSAEGCSRPRVRKSGTLCPCSVTELLPLVSPTTSV